jgi:hypothetical protein
MDVKDASTNDPSLPLIYYSVNDYERSDLHIKLHPSEYLCVELSCIYPSDSYHIKKDDDGPFLSPPPGHGKTVLFQGAVPYSSLQQVYGQKAGGSMRSLRQSVSGEARREYVMMRGPNGKGQCQVCVTEPVQTEEKEQGVSWGDRIRRLSSAVVVATGAAMLEGAGGVGGDGGGELECSMTYVNVPWQSIVIDLIKDITPDE